MILQLLRHGKAEDFSDAGDAERALVATGIERTRRTACLLASFGQLPEIVLTSPLLRARQTADEFCAAAHLPGPVVQPWLVCGCQPERLLAELVAFQDFKRVMLVGHEPDFSEFTQWILGAYGGTVEIKKGSLATLKVSPPVRRATLLSLLPPKLVGDPNTPRA